jgi:small-conductance mechanosensitive channel
MNINQEINFKIKDEFDKRGIEFAFPTQTLHLNSSSNISSPDSEKV